MSESKAKTSLYKELISRMDKALDDGRVVESAWYAYAVLEDRMRSMLRQSGGEGQNKGKGKPIRTLGKKIDELKHRSEKDSLLAAYFTFSELKAWKDKRNELVHAMADGKHTIEEIDDLADALAKDGATLARLYAARARNLKDNRDRVATPTL